MAINLTVLNTDIDYMIADLPCTLTAVNGTTLATAITGTMSEVGKEKENDIPFDMAAAELNMFDAQAVFKTSDFTTVPSVKDSLTINGVIYYVERREDGQGGAGTNFMLRRN